MKKFHPAQEALSGLMMWYYRKFRWHLRREHRRAEIQFADVWAGNFGVPEANAPGNLDSNKLYRPRRFRVMNKGKQHQTPSFGGNWTAEKLGILEKYLDTYTTALKGQPFKLMYIDAFAGAGRIALPNQDEDETKFLSGSAERAVRVANKQFDRLIFIEKRPDRCANLEKLSAKNPGRNIEIVNAEANDFLQNFHEDWRKWRGVLFLDPFATAVEWSTIQAISKFNALDTWILFPVSALARMLPRSRRPGDISELLAGNLTRVFGDESWKNLYRESPQRNLLESGPEHYRDAGVAGLISIYKENLTNQFGRRFLETSRTLKNSRNSHLFEFIFCVGNERGIKPATDIAKHILDHL